MFTVRTHWNRSSTALQGRAIEVAMGSRYAWLPRTDPQTMPMRFEPDYRHFEQVMHNRRPDRLPLYEHIVAPQVMEKITGQSFAQLHGSTDAGDLATFFAHYCNFFCEQTYDTVSYESGISSILPGKTALCGGAGPIQSRADFDAYPWDELPAQFWQQAQPRLDALVAQLPAGMKAVGGVGNGVFELAESLVGLEYLPLMQIDDPPLYADLFDAIGNLMATIWSTFCERYTPHFVAGRFGDDLGFRSSLLTNPSTVREHILPQYRRVIGIIKGAGLPFLWHSCGCIFEIMEDVMALGINAKHSNEDAIAPFDRWIELYGDRIGLLGGFDMDFLCSESPQGVYDRVLEDGRRFRDAARGYALGSGNSIPDYVPHENYLAMLRAAREVRQRER
jgi:uroporphyrinogen decarboxylase